MGNVSQLLPLSDAATGSSIGAFGVCLRLSVCDCAHYQNQHPLSIKPFKENGITYGHISQDLNWLNPSSSNAKVNGTF